MKVWKNPKCSRKTFLDWKNASGKRKEGEKVGPENKKAFPWEKKLKRRKNKIRYEIVEKFEMSEKNTAKVVGWKNKHEKEKQAEKLCLKKIFFFFFDAWKKSKIWEGTNAEIKLRKI